MGAFYHNEKYLENSLIASLNKKKGNVLYVPTLILFNIIFLYIHLCGYLGRAEQNAGLWSLGPKKWKMLAVFSTWLHLWQEKRSQPKNLMLVQTEGHVAE